MKKLISCLLIVATIAVLCSCGGATGNAKTVKLNAPSGEYCSNILGEVKFNFDGNKVVTSNENWDNGKEATLTYKMGDDGTLYFEGEGENNTTAAEWNYIKLKYDKTADVIVDADSLYVLMNSNNKYSLGKDALSGTYYMNSLTVVELTFSGDEVTAMNGLWNLDKYTTFNYRLGENGKIYFVAKDTVDEASALDWTYLSLRYDKSADVIVDPDSLFVLNKINEKTNKPSENKEDVQSVNKEASESLDTTPEFGENGNATYKQIEYTGEELKIKNYIISAWPDYKSFAEAHPIDTLTLNDYWDLHIEQCTFAKKDGTIEMLNKWSVTIFGEGGCQYGDVLVEKLSDGSYSLTHPLYDYAYNQIEYSGKELEIKNNIIEHNPEWYSSLVLEHPIESLSQGYYWDWEIGQIDADTWGAIVYSWDYIRGTEIIFEDRNIKAN